MSNYTGADAKQDMDTLCGSRHEEASAPLRRLYAAALGGVQVPGLVEHSRNQERRCEDLARQCRDAESQVSALEARVAELEREVKWRKEAEEAATRCAHDRADERDALRAQVEQARFIAGGSTSAMSDSVKALAKSILRALTAPPAETAAPCPNANCKTQGQHRHHPEGDLYTPAETTPAPARAESQCACGRPLRHCDGSQSGCFLGR